MRGQTQRRPRSGLLRHGPSDASGQPTSTSKRAANAVLRCAALPRLKTGGDQAATHAPEGQGRLRGTHPAARAPPPSGPVRLTRGKPIPQRTWRRPERKQPGNGYPGRQDWLERDGDAGGLFSTGGAMVASIRGARGLNTARDPWNGWPIPLDSRKRGIYSSYRRPNVNLNIHRIEY